MTELSGRDWSTVVDRSHYRDDIVADLDRVANLARAGDWTTLLPLLTRPEATTGPEWINTPRVGSRSGYASLHQAAWHGADRHVVTCLLELRAWRSLRTSSGRLPLDIARERGHHHLEDLLTPPVVAPYVLARRQNVETFLHALMTVRTNGLDGPFRFPQIGPIMELENDEDLWCGIPGMYGGFLLRRDGEEVVSESWIRISDGSEQEHRITAREVRLVSDGIAAARERWGLG